jgi:hypothetical protein
MFKISGAIRSARTQDGAVLLDVQQGWILSLNSMGSRVFEMLRGGLDENQIADQISRDCGVDADYVRIDILSFIRTLQEHKVLEASYGD